MLASPFATESQTHTLTASDSAGASVETTVTFFFEEKVASPQPGGGLTRDLDGGRRGTRGTLTPRGFFIRARETRKFSVRFAFGTALTPLDSLGSGSPLAEGIVRGHFMDDKASARVQTLEVVVSSDQGTVTESLFLRGDRGEPTASEF